MAITNLTGETWVINDDAFQESRGINQTYTALFNSNSETFNNIFINNNPMSGGMFYDSTKVVDPDNSRTFINQAYRTVTFETSPTGDLLAWLENNGTLTPPAPAGYEVTFVTNGGTSVTKLEDVEELPTPLPTTTKTNNIFVGWFYDSGFEEQAFSGDVISSNITLYAKWYANMEDFYQDVADEIRIKNGETEPIKHTDFAYKIKNIQGAKPEETKTVTPNFASGNQVVTPTSGKVLSQVTINKDTSLIANNIKKDVTVHGVTGSSFIAIELTQAQYDALATKDANTYYLIKG